MEVWKYGFIYELHLSVALKISYSLLSAAELRGGITNQPNTYASIELRMLRRADYFPNPVTTHLLILTAFRSCKHVTV